MTIGMPLSNYLYCGANSDSDEGESTVRILVPIIALIIGAVFVLSMLKPIEPAIQKQASPNEIVQTQQPQDDESDAIAAVKDPSLVKQVQEDVKAISDKTMAADTKVADLPVMHIVACGSSHEATIANLPQAKNREVPHG